MYVAGGLNASSGSIVAGRDIVGYTAGQVSALLTQLSTQFQPKPFTGRCPYKGLDVFTEEDVDLFFGRERLVAELTERVKKARLIVIAGPSGSGKSSLVRAGLLHALKNGLLPDSDRWLYATLKPGRDPLEQLALALSRAVKSPLIADYIRQHATEPDALNKCVESLTDQRAILFVDQFEEIFTQVAREEERAAFLNLLTHAAMVEGGRVTVLCALRSDFVSNCAVYPELNALLNQHFFQIGAMHPAELVSAIARPALEVGLRIDPDLIAQIMNDMQGEPGVLPLMQFALKDLFESEQAKGGIIALTLSDYLARGGVHQALARHADAAFAQLNEGEQQIARSVFTGLIQVGLGREDTRRTAVLEELISSGSDLSFAKGVIARLADARLVTTDVQANRETVTIVHEKLIEAWPWLKRLIDENREAIALQNQIADDAAKWEKQNHDDSYLYVGARLANVQEQLEARRLTVNSQAKEFVEASVHKQEAMRYAEYERQQKAKQNATRLRTRNLFIFAISMMIIINTIGNLDWLFVLAIVIGIIGVRRGFAKELGTALVLIATLFAVDRLLPVLEQLLNNGSLLLLGLKPVQTSHVTQVMLAQLFVAMMVVALIVAYDEGLTIAKLPGMNNPPSGIVGALLGVLIAVTNAYLLFGTVWWIWDHYQYAISAVEPPLPPQLQAIVVDGLLPLDLLGAGAQTVDSFGLLPAILIMLMILKFWKKPDKPELPTRSHNAP
jgi:ABC-type multidrug transport system fused ATPase/permease subunit